MVRTQLDSPATRQASTTDNQTARKRQRIFLRFALRYIFAAAALLAPAALAITDWSFSVSSGTTGTFSASEAGSGVSVAGNTSRLSNNFLKMDITSASGTGAPTVGDYKFAIELPAFGLFTQPFVTWEYKITANVSVGECPRASWTGIFAYGLWRGSAGTTADVSLATTPAFGIFNWNPGTNQFTISDVRNLSSYSTLSGFSSFVQSGSCSNGVITLSGSGDRAGTLRLGKYGSALFTSATERYMFVASQLAIPTAATLNGSYTAFVFDDSSRTNIYPVQLTLSGGTSASGDELTNIETGATTSNRTWSLSNLSVNSPFNGAFTGDLTLEGVGPGKAVCTTYLGSRTLIFCAMQNPADTTRAMNIVMASATAAYSNATLDTYNFGSGTGKLTTSMSGALTSGGVAAINSYGRFVQAGGDGSNMLLAGYLQNGALDTMFGSGGRVTGWGSARSVNAVAMDSASRILLTGRTPSGYEYFHVTRYTANGSLDNTFDSDGIAWVGFNSNNDEGFAITSDSSGKVVVAGTTQGSFGSQWVAVARLTTTGALDTGFSGDGKIVYSHSSSSVSYVTSLALQSDGKILVGGDAAYAYVDRLTTAGVLDSTFGSNGRAILSTATTNAAYGNAVVVQPDNRILLGATDWNGANMNFVVARLTSSGAYDTTFNTTGYRTYTLTSNDDWLRALAVQSDGKILAAGSTNDGTSDNFAILRISTNGAVDSAFGTNGVYSHNLAGGSYADYAATVLVQGDEKHLLTGLANTASGYRFGVLRLWP